MSEHSCKGVATSAASRPVFVARASASAAGVPTRRAFFSPLPSRDLGRFDITCLDCDQGIRSAEHEGMLAFLLFPKMRARRSLIKRRPVIVAHLVRSGRFFFRRYRLVGLTSGILSARMGREGIDFPLEDTQSYETDVEIVATCAQTLERTLLETIETQINPTLADALFVGAEEDEPFSCAIPDADEVTVCRLVEAVLVLSAEKPGSVVVHAGSSNSPSRIVSYDYGPETCAALGRLLARLCLCGSQVVHRSSGVLRKHWYRSPLSLDIAFRGNASALERTEAISFLCQHLGDDVFEIIGHSHE